MSAETKAALDAAIDTHYRSEAEGDNEYRQHAVIIDWVVGYTISNVVDGEVGYANGYDSGDTNPNAQVYLAQWVADRIAGLLETVRDDD